MKLNIIYENDISRRDFLKRATVGALSASPLAQLMLSVGISPQIAQSILNGKLTPFVVTTGTHYGRGSIPSMEEQFANVSQAANFAKRFTKSLWFGIDEDSYFTGRMQPSDFVKIIKALKNNDIIQIAGNKYNIYDDEDSIGLEDIDGSGVYIHIYKDELPEFIEEHPVLDNPLVTWWNKFGHGGEEIIGKEAKKIMDELGLKRKNAEYNDEDEYDEDELSSKERDEQFKTSMHQPFSYEQFLKTYNNLI